MTTYRVEIDGKTVWSDKRDDDLGAKAFPAEYLARPADPEEGEPYPPAHVLFLNDEIIGVQISRAEEDPRAAAREAVVAAALAAFDAETEG